MSDADEITANIAAVGGWRADRLAHLRTLILKADPDAVEQIKWRKPSNPAGVPTYSHDGLVCTLEHYNDKVKVTFAKGGQLEDRTGRFTGNGVRRAIDLHEDTELDDAAFQQIVRDAVALNRGAA